MRKHADWEIAELYIISSAISCFHGETNVRTFAKQFMNIKPRRKNVKTRLLFSIGKMMQKRVLKNLPQGQKLEPDLQYWLDQGWL